MNTNQKNKILLILPLVLLLTTYYLLPKIGHAEAVTKLIPCGEMQGTGDDATLKECTFNDLLILFRNVVDYVGKYLVLPGATISLAIVGWKLMTSADNSGERTKAKSSALKVVIGIVVILAAWLIVRTVLKVFLTDSLINNLPINF